MAVYLCIIKQEVGCRVWFHLPENCEMMSDSDGVKMYGRLVMDSTR